MLECRPKARRTKIRRWAGKVWIVGCFGCDGAEFGVGGDGGGGISRRVSSGLRDSSAGEGRVDDMVRW